MIITLAEKKDLDGVISLLKANHIDYMSEENKPDGFVTTNFTPPQMEALIVQERGVIIAKEDEKILAFATAASWEFWSEWPFFAYMIEKLPEFTLEGTPLTVENSYQYGPVCVDKSMRGTGLFEQVFYASLESMKERYPIMVTFINKINPRSYAAHTQKVPMTEAGTFEYNQNNYYIMACPTDLKP